MNDVQKLIGAILYHSIQDENGAIINGSKAYAQLATAKRELTLLLFDHIYQLKPEMHLLRLVTPEDIDLILQHASDKTRIRNLLLEGAQTYQQHLRETVYADHPPTEAIGYKVINIDGDFVMEIHGHQDYIDNFFGKINTPHARWKPDFGIMGPYLVFKASKSLESDCWKK